MIRPVVAERTDDAGDDEVAATHSYRAGNEDRLSAETVDVQDRGDREEELEDADNAGREERDCAAGKSDLFKYLWCIIINCVDPGPVYLQLVRVGGRSGHGLWKYHCWNVMVRQAAMVRLKRDGFVTRDA